METYLPTFSHFPVVSEVSTTGETTTGTHNDVPEKPTPGEHYEGPVRHWRPRAQGQELGTERDETQRGDNGKTQRGHGGFIV